MFKSRRTIYRTACFFLFIVYLAILMNVLFFSDYYGRTDLKSEYTYNLIPFKEINRFIKYRDYMTFEDWTTNLFGNVLAFIPLGFFLPLMNVNYRKFFKVLFSCFFISLFVECLQLYYKVGIFDVDDLFLNSLGGVIGYVIYKVVYKVYQGGKNNAIKTK